MPDKSLARLMAALLTRPDLNPIHYAKGSRNVAGQALED
jgi:hypothetical protein